MKVCILGVGSWGMAQGLLLHHNQWQVAIWGRPEDDIQTIAETRKNERYLPGVVLPPAIMVTSDIAQALEEAAVVVAAVPSQAFREVLEKAVPFLRDSTYLVNTAKGLEMTTGMRLSQVAASVLGSEIHKRYAVLSGPSHAEEVVRQIPTAVTVASYDEETAFFVQDLYMSPVFRVYTNPDVAGVELGGALKNIVALASGMVIGLGYGDNTIAALMTRGLTEMIRMGQAMGGDARTFSGLSGMGDLVVTCCSRYSRNRRAGELIGQGHTLEETLERVGMVVEGAHATRAVHRIASEMQVEMPITRSCYQVLYKQVPVREAVNHLMMRPKKHEIEEIMP